MKKEALLRELVKLAKQEEIMPHEFTSDEYKLEYRRDKPSATDDAVRHALKRLVDRGLLKCRKATVNGKQCNAYSAR